MSFFYNYEKEGMLDLHMPDGLVRGIFCSDQMVAPWVSYIAER